MRKPPPIPDLKPKAKPLHKRTAEELRAALHSQDQEVREEAMGELEGRRANLKDAVVPAWEIAERGPDYERWSVV